MLKLSEQFFIEKIQQGLPLLDNKMLSDEDIIMLTTPYGIYLNKSSEEKIESMRIRYGEMCPLIISALNAAYANDIKNIGRPALLEWRTNNEHIYKCSRTMLSVIVQDWYLIGGGRKQEKQAASCLPLLMIIVIPALAYLIN